MPIRSFSSKNAPYKPKEPVAPPEVYTRWVGDPSQDNMSSLLAKLDPVINKVIYSNSASGDPGIKMAAKLHLAKAMPNYDPKRGAGLETFAVSELRRLPRIIEKRSAAIPIYEGAKLNLNLISAKEREYKAANGVDPTDEQLADASGMSIKKMTYLRKKYSPTMTDAQFSASRVNDNGDETGDGIATNNYERGTFIKQLLYADLGSIDQRIFEMAHGLNGKKQESQTHIAHTLGLSNAAITNHLKKINAQLAEMEGTGFLR